MQYAIRSRRSHTGLLRWHHLLRTNQSELLANFIQNFHSFPRPTMTQILIILLGLLLPKISAIPHYNSASHPSSATYTKVTDVLHPLLAADLQPVLLTSVSRPVSTPELALQLIERATHLERPIQILPDSYSLERTSCGSLRHSGYNIVFLYVSPVGPSHGILRVEHPLAFHGPSFTNHLYPYLLVYLVDESYLKDTVWPVIQHTACCILSNIVYLQFWSLEPKIPVNKYALQYRCDGDPFCMPTLESTSADGRLHYKPVMKELQQNRRNFHGYRLGVNSPDFRPKTWLEVRIMFTDPFRIENGLREHTPHVPLYHLAENLNISLNFYVEMPTDACDVGWVDIRLLATCSADLDMCIPFVLEQEQQEYLVQATELEQFFPLAFRSILSPMGWGVWLLLGLVTLLVCVVQALKSQWSDCYVWLIITLAYYCDQDFSITNANRLWCTFWILLMFFISTFYTTELQSLQIVPRVMLKNTSVTDIVERSSTFYADFATYGKLTAYAEYRENANDFRSEKSLRFLQHLASVVQPVPSYMPASDIRQSMRNSSTVWLATHAQVEAYVNVFTQQLGVSCQVLTMPILAYFSWTMLYVPHGDVFLEKYRFLTDAGIVQYWARREHTFKGDLAKDHLLKVIDFDDEDDTDDGSADMTVGLSDSILGEAFCLYALCVAISLASASVEVICSQFEFY